MHLILYPESLIVTLEAKWAEDQAKQARTVLHPSAQEEIRALKTLNWNGCSSAPTLLAQKEDVQGAHDWVPGGYILYLLMNKLPGIQVPWVTHLCPEEQAAFEDAFKKAWLYVLMSLAFTLFVCL